jgi:hypothetical protein
MNVHERIEAILDILGGDAKEGMAFLIGYISVVEEKARCGELFITLEEFLISHSKKGK